MIFIYFFIIILKIFFRIFIFIDAGKILEFDHPYLLIQNHNSAFRAMCEKCGDFTELVETAKIKYNSDINLI